MPQLNHDADGTETYTWTCPCGLAGVIVMPDSAAVKYLVECMEVQHQAMTDEGAQRRNGEPCRLWEPSQRALRRTQRLTAQPPGASNIIRPGATERAGQPFVSAIDRVARAEG